MNISRVAADFLNFIDSSEASITSIKDFSMLDFLLTICLLIMSASEIRLMMAKSLFGLLL